MRKLSQRELDRRFAPVEAVSDYLEGLPVSCYGDSGGYVGLTVPSGGTVYPYCSVNYIDRLQRRLKSPAGVPGNNNSVVGAQANETAMYACSNQTAASRKGTAVSGLWTPSALPSGLVIVGTVANDVIHYAAGSGAKGQAGCQNGLDGLIRILQAQSILQDTNAAFAYTGTWTSQALAGLPGGNSHFTSTNGNHVTVTTPAGTDFDLMLLGWDDTAVGSTFAAFTVTVDGGAPANFAWNPGTTSLQCKQGTSVGAGFNSVPLCIPLRGLSNATHSIVVTHNDTTGRFLYVSQLLTKSPTPPTIMFVKWIYPAAAGLAAAGITTAQIDTFNGYIDTVAARFPSDGSVLVADPLHAGWDSSTMISSQDSSAHVHPNDLGMKCWADSVMQVLARQALPPRQGLIIQ